MPHDSHERTWTWIDGLTASSTRLAFVHGATGVARYGLVRAASPVNVVRTGATLVAGPQSGPFAYVSGDLAPGETCRGERSGPGGFDLAGSVLAYGEVVEPCDGSRASGDIRLVVASPGRRWSLGRLESGPAYDVAIAGRFVAWIEPASTPPAVAVYDWTNDRLAYWVAHPPGKPYMREVQLRRDGTILFAASAGHHRGGGVYAASVRSPWPRRILAAPRIEAIRLAGRRFLALVTSSKDREYLDPSHSAVVLSDLRGRSRTLARYGRDARIGHDPDFDGVRAAWSIHRRLRLRGEPDRTVGAIEVRRVGPEVVVP